ncbi:hypothetical protein K491DRAFT_696419 [Lophiostoma macrostomum CBS 122681]|uniref:Lytic polysaccharide monooxygenase n=1 Tax=Lophiostoma macrostomum CBS 122681 TaxID=1314788 RepID=A0A6A6SV01_9PLEO|nr:hypothetical protein K491DRAFT_696419 [Lophiostoma macrostomum CBS 122681]
MYTKSAFISLFLASAPLLAVAGDCGINPSGDAAPYCSSSLSRHSLPSPTHHSQHYSYNNCDALEAASISYSCATEAPPGPTAYRREKRADEPQWDEPVALSTGYDHTTSWPTGGPVVTGGPIPTGVPLCWTYVQPSVLASGQQPGYIQYPCYAVEASSGPKWSLSGKWAQPTVLHT